MQMKIGRWEGLYPRNTERSKAYPLRFRLWLPENCRSVPVGTERDHWCRSTGCTRS
jgi:hypothetical protein